MEAKEANKMSIRQYLADRGINPQQEHIGYGMYKSPLRKKENFPSFKVDYNANLWYDFGCGAGGTFIDLYMRLESCDFQTAIQRIEQGSFSFHGHHLTDNLFEGTITPNQIKIIETISIENEALLQYAHTRGIAAKLLRKYCKEIHYCINKNTYFAIGFQTDAGGWVLRNKYFKGNIAPASIRTINNNATRCIVFEGFMDLLSYLTLYPEKEFHINYIVLNSTSHIKKAISFLKTQEHVISMLDNDEAGRAAKNKLGSELAELNVPVADDSKSYAAYKDLNEYLQHQQRNTETVAQEKPAPIQKKDRSNDFGMSM